MADNNSVGWRPDGIRADRTIDAVPTTMGPSRNPTMTLAHELAHVLFNWTNGSTDIWITREQFKDNFGGNIPHDISISDIFTTHMENQIRAEHGQPLRTHYINDTFGRGIGPELINQSNKGVFSEYYDKNSQTNYKPLKSNVTPFYYIKK